jgi:hypothetical protein
MDLSTSSRASHMIIYRYNWNGQVNPVVRRKEFSRLSLEELSNIHLPVPSYQLFEDFPETCTEQNHFRKNSNEYLLMPKASLINTENFIPFSFSKRKIKYPKNEVEIEKKKKPFVHTFSNANSPQPILTMYNPCFAKKMIKNISQHTIPNQKKLGKSINNLQKLVAYQEKCSSSLKTQDLRRLPARKRFKIWDSFKYDFRMI